MAVPERCPHQECRVEGRMIRWGRYQRYGQTGEERIRLAIQRVRCQACGRTQALLPDFLHPHRWYVLRLLHQVVLLYLLEGLGFEQVLKQMPSGGPARETIREWVSAFAYGAGYLLLEVLRRFVAGLEPLAELPEEGAPPRLERSEQADLLQQSYHFWQWGEVLYARIKDREARTDYSAGQFLAFLLHWLQKQGFTPRLFWSPRLKTTPRVPFAA
jgi:hypothetical protein